MIAPARAHARLICSNARANAPMFLDLEARPWTVGIAGAEMASDSRQFAEWAYRSICTCNIYTRYSHLE